MKPITGVPQQLVLAFVGFTTLLAVGGPPEYEISRSTVDGGGVMHSTGGDFQLSGSIGQPDAGVLTGGGFTLTGGFWFALMPTDCNEDGAVGLLDHATFESCLTGPGAGVSAGCECFDVNRSGTVDMADFAEAQIAFTGS